MWNSTLTASDLTHNTFNSHIALSVEGGDNYVRAACERGPRYIEQLLVATGVSTIIIFDTNVFTY